MFFSLLPLILFLLLFLSSGLYFSINAVQNPFYQLSPLLIILPCIALSWILHNGTSKTKQSSFLNGIANHDILTTCIPA
ncbi:hypothetical protein [Candidatus Fokinia solitaria]|uniref:hypothetical protein n=1 Tax=Candidatus Fokinia solitaria TaxID=1802984 RepID=UPI0011AB2E26|nr:hypothetical protein [Candidatus Fokinia solitaria]